MLAIIRHGATQANKERRYLGKTDASLSEEGVEALRYRKTRDFYPEVRHLFISPMKRCVETAEIIYPGLCPVTIPEWEEMDFGRFEYRNYEELKDNVQYREWIGSGGTRAFPGGESRGDFILRCKSGFVRMCKELSLAVGRYTAEPVQAGIIVHGGTIMSLLSLYGGLDYFDCQVLNGRGYVCRLTGIGNGMTVQEDQIRIEVVEKI